MTVLLPTPWVGWRETDSIPLYPGVSEMLQDLASGHLALALLSSNSRNNVLRILGPHLSDQTGYPALILPRQRN